MAVSLLTPQDFPTGLIALNSGLRRNDVLCNCLLEGIYQEFDINWKDQYWQ